MRWNRGEVERKHGGVVIRKHITLGETLLKDPNAMRFQSQRRCRTHEGA